jgi:hypothetical protein
MPTKHSPTEPERGFDAVAESRRWKEAVAAETAGMSIPERIAWFRSQSSVAAIRERGQLAEGEPMVRGDPGEYGTKKP